MCLFRLFLLILTLKLQLILQVETESLKEHINLTEVNGYYYGWLSTPNYPEKFITPFVKEFVLDVQRLQRRFTSPPIINVYLTEVYLQDNIIFTDGEGSPLVEGLNHRAISTNSDLLYIKVNISDLYKDHLRVRDKAFHNFGFNISIEVVESDKYNGTNDWSCSIWKCSAAGTCKSFPGAERLEFGCDCMKGFSGRECQYAPRCDPRKNITFCINGGKCRFYGLIGIGACECPAGYSGPKCQIEPFHAIDCPTNGITDRPCSLCNNKFSSSLENRGKKDWYRYIALLQNNKTKRGYEKIFKDMFDTEFIIGRKMKSTRGIVLEVYGKVYNESFVLPHGMSVSRSDSVIQSVSSNGVVLNGTIKPEIHINKELPLLEGNEFSLTCKAKLYENATDYLYDFKWFKNHELIQPSYTSRHIKQYQSIHERGKEMWSVLMIDFASAFDNGVFTCQVTDLLRNVQECYDFSMKVLYPPQIEVDPMSITTFKNSSLKLVCSDSTEEFHVAAVNHTKIAWYKDEMPIEMLKDSHSDIYATEDTFPDGQLLTVFSVHESETLICKALNKAGKTSRSVSIKVLKNKMNPYESCNEIWEDYIAFRMPWGLTSVNQTAMSKCPKGFKGFAQKNCSVGNNKLGEWGRTDFSRCTHDTLFQYNFTFQNVRVGYTIPKEGIDFLHSYLNEYLNMRRRDKPSKLFLGEGDKFITMLVDVWEYLDQVSSFSPHLMSNGTVQGLMSVADKFVGFPSSCVHKSSVFHLVTRFFQFVQSHKIEAYEGNYLFVQSFALTVNETFSNLIEMNTTNVRLEFDYYPIDYGEKERWMTFTTLSDLDELNNDDELISDIVAINITDQYFFKKDSHFEIQFQIQYIHKSMTCAGLIDFKWVHNSCKLMNVSVDENSVSCVCDRFGIYGVLGLKEDLDVRPRAKAFISLPPNWIAASGCIVCLVLCFRSLICSIFHKIYCSYFILSTLGTSISILALLYLILMYESTSVAMLYMNATLLTKSLRIWRMIWVYDTTEVFPWLERVSKWIVLAGVIMTFLLPLWTAFTFSLLYSENEFILCQTSPVFLTFAVLIAIAVFIIIIVHYKTYMWIHTKSPNKKGDRRLLNENLLSALIHLVQILSVVCYLNLKQSITFHYIFAILNCILGLSWRMPRNKLEQKAQTNCNNTQYNNNPRMNFIEAESLNRSRSTSTCAGSANSNRFRNNKNFEKQTQSHPMELSLRRKYSSTIDDDDEDNDHVTLQTSVSTISNNGTESSGNYYAGSYPLRGKCLISYDDNYVLSDKHILPSK